MSETLDEKLSRMAKAGQLAALNISTVFSDSSLYAVTHRKEKISSTNIRQCKVGDLVETIHALLDEPFPAAQVKPKKPVKVANRDDDLI